eukprot:6409622-Amphidinium_carterae.1
MFLNRGTVQSVKKIHCLGNFWDNNKEGSTTECSLFMGCSGSKNPKNPFFGECMGQLQNVHCSLDVL